MSGDVTLFALSAGNGLTGTAYDGSVARSLSLGTPGTLDGSTTNNVTLSSHTHVINSTTSRTNSSTTTLLAASAMNDHRTSADHDSRYINIGGFNDSEHGNRGGGSLHALATTTTHGFMSSTDKSKLNGIDAGAEANVATNLSMGGSGNSRTINSSTGSNVSVPVVTTSNAGFMSTTDKTKLNGIESGAEANTVTSVAGRTGAVTLSTLSPGNGLTGSTYNGSTSRTFAMSGSYTGTFTTTGDVRAGSDRRLKDTICPISTPLEMTRSMSGWKYHRTDLDADQYGVIAQELQAIMPEAVGEGEDGMLSVAYNQLIPVLLEAIKELDAKVAILEAR